MKTFLTALILCGIAAAQSTSTVSATGDGQSPQVTFTLLSKSTVSLAWTATTATATPGGSVALTISSSTTRLEPASIQFTLSAPSPSVSGFTVTAGPTATAAGKAVTCAVPTSPAPPAGTTLVNCIVSALSATPIGNGVIANVSVAVPTAAPAGTASITLSGFSTANAWGNAIQASIPTATAASVVTVQPGLTLNCIADPDTLTPVAYQIEAGEQIACTVTLSGAAATATTVTLASNATSSPGVTVPASVVIAAGQTSANFTATGI